MAKLVYDLEVYTFDIDLGGHVNNGVYIRWMEIGRTRMMEAIGWPIQETEKRGFYPVLIHTEIDYNRPLFMGDRVRVEMWVSKITKARAYLEFRFYNGDRIPVAEARQTGAFIHLETHRPRRLTPEERALFLPFTLEENLIQNPEEQEN